MKLIENAWATQAATTLSSKWPNHDLIIAVRGLRVTKIQGGQFVGDDQAKVWAYPTWRCSEILFCNTKHGLHGLSKALL